MKADDEVQDNPDDRDNRLRFELNLCPGAGPVKYPDRALPGRHCRATT